MLEWMPSIEQLGQTDLNQLKNPDGSWSQIGMLLVAVASTCTICGILFRLLLKSYDTRIEELQKRCTDCEADRKLLHDELAKLRKDLESIASDRPFRSRQE